MNRRVGVQSLCIELGAAWNLQESPRTPRQYTAHVRESEGGLQHIAVHTHTQIPVHTHIYQHIHACTYTSTRWILKDL